MEVSSGQNDNIAGKADVGFYGEDGESGRGNSAERPLRRSGLESKARHFV
jgi:hypothetical protein